MTEDDYKRIADNKIDKKKAYLIAHNNEYKAAANKKTVSKMLTVASAVIIGLTVIDPVNGPLTNFGLGIISTLLVGCFLMFMDARDKMNRIFDSATFND